MAKKIHPTPGANELHGWWQLSYASYLTIPRSVLQAMPDEWQGRLAKLLHEADEIVTVPLEGTYAVQLRGRDGRFVRDPLANYRHPSLEVADIFRKGSEAVGG